MALVFPAGQVGSWRGGLLDALHDLWQVHGVVVQAREIVGQRGVAVPAVLGAVAVFHFAFVGRVAGLQKILQQVDGVVQKIVVGAADVDVELALQLRAQRRPVALEDVAQIVVLFPVGGDLWSMSPVSLSKIGFG